MRSNSRSLVHSNAVTLASLTFPLLACVSLPTARSAEKLDGDHIATSDSDLIIHPINHATFVMGWKDKTIYVDPVGGGKRFGGLPKPDLILVTDAALSLSGCPRFGASFK